jgi:hypothetical protein
VLVLCAAATLYGQTATQPDVPRQEHKKSWLERRSTFVPPLSTANSAGRLDPGQKFELFVYNTVNPYPLLATTARAGIGQAADWNHNYGQGAEGYGKRFGAAYADNASTQFFGTFLYPVLLRQDSRYFRKSSGSASVRIGYAISRVFVTRTDSGRSAPNASFWLASATAAALSNTYYPPGDRSAGDAAWRFGIAFGSQAGFNVAKEFWPDVKRKLSRKK